MQLLETLLAASVLGNVACVYLVYHYGHKDTAAARKLEIIENELDLIEQQADRRIVPAIMKVTAQLKSLL
jgi:hypothetical protein